MFSNAYQNGTHIQVFDSKVNSDKNQFYKQLYKIQPNSIKKYFDKQVKSYLYEFQSLTSKINFPADDHKQLSLHQRYLVLQLHIPLGSHWSMEIGMTDISKTKRRINLTTNVGKQQTKYFFFKYPVPYIQKGVWLFLAIDVMSFMQVFKGQVFRSLDHISVGSCCRLRRIFTMKQWNQWDIPNSYWLPGDIQQQMQLIQYNSKQKEANMVKSQPVQQISRIKQKETPKKVQKQKDYDFNLQKKNNINQKSPLSKGKSIEYSQNNINKNHSQKNDKLIINGIGKNQHLKGLSNDTKINYPKSMVRSQVSRQLKSNKIRVNTMQDHQQKVSKSYLGNQKIVQIHNPHYQQKNSKIKKSDKKSIQKERVHSKSKGPILQKSFQEDQALMVPAQQSDIPFVQSNDHYQKQTKKIERQQQIQQDKWSDQQGQISKSPSISTPFSQHIQNMSNGFPSTTITKQNNQTVVVQKINQKSKIQLELIYDQMVGCYYHPQTNTYYEINN